MYEELQGLENKVSLKRKEYLLLDMREYQTYESVGLLHFEISFLFPWVFGLNNIKLFGIFTMIMFVIILIIGFYYEWKKGALKWSQL